jgi:flagellar biosynthesis/type III secretory pathway protein FliH
MSRASNAVIKSSAAQQVNPLFGSAKVQTASVAASTPEDPRDIEIERLRQQISELEESTPRHDAALKNAFDEGFAAGQDAAEAEFDDNREKALEVLSAGIDAATAELKASLARFEGYSLQAAGEALDVLIGDGGTFQQIVGQAIARQVTDLGKKAVLSITVSRSDFPDSREVAQLAPSLADIEAKIVVSNDMRAGRCDIKLMVGTAEIDVRKSWSDILKILSESVSDAIDAAS